MTKYQDIEVTLIGTDGNAFAILGAVNAALRHGAVGKDERDEFTAEATSGDYSHLLATAMRWVTVI